MDVSIGGDRLLRLFFAPLVVVIASFYLFPFEFSFAVGVNTKMAMAGFGIFVFLSQMVMMRNSSINRGLLRVFLWGVLVSICGLVSVFYNGTSDYAYATYAVSMFVWVAAANVVVLVIKEVHGYVSAELICRYLIAVCVFQCAAALAIENFELVRTVVNTYVVKVASTVSSGNSLEEAGRLYGIGSALDVAGSRFSAILVIIAFCTMRTGKSWKELTVLLCCFVFVLIVGSAISRTTIIGAVLAVAYWLYSFMTGELAIKKSVFWKCGLTIIVLSGLIIIYLYNNSQAFYNNFRFAFEAFFNWAESGELRTNSTDILKDMYRFPDTVKTWIIGDGYFADPHRTDPYFTGISYSAFYMGIDAGYLRFIYYFGVIGLATFIIYFFKVAKKCIDNSCGYKVMFIFLLFVNFIVWIKVSTDIFLIFAPFLCISRAENEASDAKDIKPGAY